MPERVLIVEDEETLRQNLEKYLAQQGYEAAGFGSAEEALEEAARRDFDVALLDIRLPGRDGLSLAADLSARVSAQIKELWPRLPAGSTLVLHDRLARRPNLYAVFGSLPGQAITLTTRSSTTVEYLPQVGQWTEARVHLPAGDAPGSLVELRLGDDGLEPLER